MSRTTTAPKRTLRRYSYRTLTHARLMLSSGSTCKEVAARIGAPLRTVRAWSNRWFPAHVGRARAGLAKRRQYGKADAARRALRDAPKIGIAAACRLHGICRKTYYRYLTGEGRAPLPRAERLWNRRRAEQTRMLRRALAVRFEGGAEETGKPPAWERVGEAIGMTGNGARRFVQVNCHRLGYEWEAICRPVPAEPRARAA